MKQSETSCWTKRDRSQDNFINVLVANYCATIGLNRITSKILMLDVVAQGHTVCSHDVDLK